MLIRTNFSLAGVKRERQIYVPSFALFSEGDDEHAPSMTHRALESLREVSHSPLDGLYATQWAVTDAGEPFIWEIRVQPSRAARYRGEPVQAQGMDVRRITFLRGTGAPVLLAFGMNDHAVNYDQAWLHDLPDTPIRLDTDPTRPRMGWAVNRPPWENGPLRVPDWIPRAQPRTQEELI